MQLVVEGKNRSELSRSNIWNTFLQSSISRYREFVNQVGGFAVLARVAVGLAWNAAGRTCPRQ
jgi:hypothetical protein